MALIEAKGLSKKYFLGEETETVALANGTFSIEEGEFVSIMGPSGSGKSTLLHILGFLDRASSGTYRFSGKAMHELSDEELARVRNEEMGFVFQAFNLLPRTPVLDNVMLPLLYSDVKEDEWKKRAEEALESVGMSHRLLYDPAKLSGGERQRVAIARALVTKPKVLFADEPTGNLDSVSGNNVMEIFKNLNTEGTTVVLITHDRSVAERARRIIHIKDGVVEKEEIVQQ